MASSHTTTNHEVIRLWATDRGGVPAAVAETSSDDDAGLLRIYFPEDGEEDALTEISWDNFFTKFEEANLAFVYDIMTDGNLSRFSRLVSR